MQRSIRAWTPFLAYAAIVVIHLGQIAVADPDRATGKALLMPVLLGVVLYVALGPERDAFRGGRAVAGLVGLPAGIVLSCVGDILLAADRLLPGLASFAAAHVAYIAVFTGPGRVHRPTAWALIPVGWTAALVPVLWPHLGGMATIVLLYGFVLAGTAATATGVSTVTAAGGALFLASDSLLAFRLFWPDFGRVFPDPWQDMAVMALYCAGEGLIAYGVVRRLAAAGRGERAADGSGPARDRASAMDTATPGRA
ncbi:lysoplasmalogenase [Microbacterium rhizophilus]|uniref:lysoplasmalogenase n=1 Tax=Microbacterium rhizophilus TaxID=3138934 RepID=UPI0031E7D9C3